MKILEFDEDMYIGLPMFDSRTCQAVGCEFISYDVFRFVLDHLQDYKGFFDYESYSEEYCTQDFVCDYSPDCSLWVPVEREMRFSEIGERFGNYGANLLFLSRQVDLDSFSFVTLPNVQTMRDLGRYLELGEEISRIYDEIKNGLDDYPEGQRETESYSDALSSEVNRATEPMREELVLLDAGGRIKKQIGQVRRDTVDCVTKINEILEQIRQSGKLLY